jgi:type II secretory pathway pseudopilin PulG
MLCVLAIVGLLMGLLLPSLGAVRTSALRQRTGLQLRGLATALEDYAAHYGHPPPFLAEAEVPVPLAPLGDRFAVALQGLDGPADATNPDNVRFYVFDSAERDGDGRPLDAFGGGEIYAMGRRKSRLTIPREAFPEQIRDLVPEGGVPAPFALWSLSGRPGRRGTSWQ